MASVAGTAPKAVTIAGPDKPRSTPPAPLETYTNVLKKMAARCEPEKSCIRAKRWHFLTKNARNKVDRTTWLTTGCSLAEAWSPNGQRRRSNAAFNFGYSAFSSSRACTHITAPSVAFIGDENAACAPAFFPWKGSRMKKRLRIKHEKTFQQRLAEEAERFRAAAEALPAGTARELLLRRVRQTETAANIDNWLRSPGTQPPPR